MRFLLRLRCCDVSHLSSARRTPSCSMTSLLSRSPAVSLSNTRKPPMSTVVSMTSRVVPAMGETMAASRFAERRYMSRPVYLSYFFHFRECIELHVNIFQYTFRTYRGIDRIRYYFSIHYFLLLIGKIIDSILRELSRLLFPTFGSPTIATRAPLRRRSPRLPSSKCLRTSLCNCATVSFTETEADDRRSVDGNETMKRRK